MHVYALKMGFEFLSYSGQSSHSSAILYFTKLCLKFIPEYIKVYFVLFQIFKELCSLLSNPVQRVVFLLFLLYVSCSKSYVPVELYVCCKDVKTSYFFSFGVGMQ